VFVYYFDSFLFLLLYPQREPWAGQDAIEVVLTVCAGERMSLPASVPPHIASLMLRCWDHDSSARPSFGEIMSVLQGLEGLGGA
jgi:hypothetical protein